MKRLQVVHYPIFGGPHNEALRLDGPLAERGWETTVLIPDEPGNALGRLQDGGVDVVTIPLGRIRAVKSPAAHLRFGLGMAPQVAAIRRLIRERHVDLVQISGLVNPHAAIAARLEGVPLVWQIVDTMTPVPVRTIMMPLVTRLADSVMTTGLLTARQHPGLSAMGERAVPYYPPVDCRVFMPKAELRDEVRTSWGLTDCRPIIGEVGNINPMKGIQYLIDATALMRKGEAPPRLVLVGTEYNTHRSYSDALRTRIASLGLIEGDDVIFLGARSDVERQLQGMDLVAMGSVPHSEGTPTAILEAAACGVPAVATDVGGVSEIIENGVTGFVEPPLSGGSIANAATRILSNPELYARMRADSRSRAVERFDVEVCADTHVRAFDLARAHHAGRRSARRPAA